MADPGSRTHGDVALFLAGAALFEGSRLLARRKGIEPVEEQVFRAANDASDAIRTPVRAVMQMGTFGTVPAVAAVAFLAGDRRLAAALGVGGSAAWLLAKVAKPLGGRARPAALLPDVHVREGIAGDLGWVSGHTAVATTIACTAWRATPGWSHPLMAGGVATTAFGRMYVGAHLPLDLVGGAGLGLAVSAIARRLLRD
jgi:membrane-associated phospholipid phosphatase